MVMVEQEYYLSYVLLARKCLSLLEVPKRHVKILARRKGLTYLCAISISMVDLQT